MAAGERDIQDLNVHDQILQPQPVAYLRALLDQDRASSILVIPKADYGRG